MITQVGTLELDPRVPIFSSHAYLSALPCLDFFPLPSRGVRASDLHDAIIFRSELGAPLFWFVGFVFAFLGWVLGGMGWGVVWCGSGMGMGDVWWVGGVREVGEGRNVSVVFVDGGAWGMEFGSTK